MPSQQPVFRSAFMSPDDEFNGLGRKPFVFDVIAPDGETSILPDSMKMVLSNNPDSAQFSYSQVITRLQTKGGFVEQHWGEGLRNIQFSLITGGFKRLWTGLSNITGGGIDTKGNRRESINYDKYLDMLALFSQNGAIYDRNGNVVFSGKIKITFDGGIYLGWFDNFNVEEASDKPYQFTLSTTFTIDTEILRFRTTPVGADSFLDSSAQGGASQRLLSGSSQSLDPVLGQNFADLFGNLE